MAEITLKFDSKNPIAKKALDFILSLGVFTKVEKNALDLSLEDVKKGRVTSHKNASSYFKQI